MPDKPTQKNRELAIETPLGEDVLLMVRMSGAEKLGRLFEYNLELASENQQIKAEDIVGKNVTIRLDLGAGRTRYFNGHVSSFSQLGGTGTVLSRLGGVAHDRGQRGCSLIADGGEGDALLLGVLYRQLGCRLAA